MQEENQLKVLIIGDVVGRPGLDRLKKDGIKWVSFSGIDNVLSRPTDPVFLGATVSSRISDWYKKCLQRRSLF